MPGASTRPIDRVRRLLDAARSVAGDPDLVRLLVSSTGLSPEGVALGLTYLETDASDADLATLVSGATPSPRVQVILSANVFTAALRALAVACAASPVVSVRPSRRDPVFTRALVTRLSASWLTLEEAAEVSGMADGEVHVYGRDETVAAVRAAARPGVRVRGHGVGMGVAVVSAGAELAEAARAMANDVAVFDQRGCLSPRVALVVGTVDRGERFAVALDARLSELGRSVPRGRMVDGEVREATRYLETMAFAGKVLPGDGHAVGLALDGGVLVPPPGRHVHVAVVVGAAEARAALRPIERLVVAVGSDDRELARALAVDAERVRVAPLGRMQRPPLDGPVDLR